MTNSWLVLTPPIVVLVMAFVTKRLNPSLITGIILAALIAVDFNPLSTGKLVVSSLWSELTALDSIFIYSFLIMLGSVVALVIRTGGAAAFTRFATHKMKNKKQAETTSILFSFSLFIDDYLSNSTVGYVMRPLTDKFKVARAKLAFLVHSIATPLVVLAPISGWSAMIVGRLQQAGVTPVATEKTEVLANSFYVYLHSIPFIFYSFLMLASVWFIVRRRISYGPMSAHEVIAEKTGNLLGGKEDTAEPLENKQHARGTLADLFVPLTLLIGSITIGTLFTDRLIAALALGIDISASFLALFLAGSFTLITSLLFSLRRKKISTSCIPHVLREGIQLMLDPIIMLFLAATLGTIVQHHLFTGQYLAGIMVGTVSLTLIPLMLFLVSAAIAIATGTSWGTIAIMAPITIPMVAKLSQAGTPAPLASVALLFPAIGAILSGAVCGDHVSPVSETTIMAASSAGSTPVDHATTQFFYALPAIACACMAFLISGFFLGYNAWLNSSLSIGISMIICLLLLYLLNKSKNYKPRSSL